MDFFVFEQFSLREAADIDCTRSGGAERLGVFDAAKKMVRRPKR